MTFPLLAYLGGVLTLASPCVLPVLPFLFSRTGQPFARGTLPTLAGLALTFALVATGAAVGGGRVVRANEAGRYAALALLGLSGLALLLPRQGERLTRPFVSFGAWLQGAGSGPPSVRGAFLSGAALGFLWAPCAGPILGIVLGGAALGGASASTLFLLLAFAAGAATSLAVALLTGGQILHALRRHRGAEAGMKRAMGLVVLGGAAALALGWDGRLLSRLALIDTAAAEERLVRRLAPARAPDAAPRGAALDGLAAEEARESLPVEGTIPEFSGATAWLNSPPLTPASLRGKVVLVEFWTFNCYNCLNALPHVKALNEKYREKGLVVVGVHTPEFPFEARRENVERAVRRLGVTFPVAMDNDYRIWRAYGNRYWPAAYFVDATGRIRYHHFGEGRYEEQERVVRKLLVEAALP